MSDEERDKRFKARSISTPTMPAAGRTPEERIRNMETELTKLRERAVAQEDRMHSRADGLQGHIDAVEKVILGQLDSLGERMTGDASRAKWVIGLLVTGVFTFAGSAAAVVVRAAQVETRVESLQRDIARTEGGTAPLRGAVEDLRVTVGTLATEIRGYREGQADKVEALTQRVSRLERRR